MRVIVGTSGYSYKEWKGTFYPADLPAAKMLPFYAGHFGSVEINNTFYRMPEEKTLTKWASDVPDDFTFVLKAPQRITHQKRLAGVQDDVRQFLDVSKVLGPKLGPLLFQLPPYQRKETAKLRDFLSLIPRETRVALEVRHDSWLADDVYDALREHDAALCLSDTDEVADSDALLVPTASWGYLRLRRTEYPGDTLTEWARRVEAQSWSDTYVFFKHEDEGKGPAFAKQFLAALR
ncbi:MAG TPA: DUF72 domain-containing protein [Thermoanaerobaculia bacterium]|jgi:uncharacterized protein YecE (DUF72 family)|nr:DUF72 domain-containing protein [Thermoanaerobaculia bacterium]